MKANILTLLTAVYGGGAENLVLTHLKHFNKKKFHLYVISLRKGNLYNKFKKIGNQDYFSLDVKNRFSIKGFLRLVNFIRKKNIKIVHTHLIEADMYGFLLKILFPNITILSTRHGENRFRKKFNWRLINFMFSLLEKKIIVVSESLKRFIKKYEFIPKRKLELIHNGIDINYFKKEDHSILRNKFENQNIEQKYLIGIVGRLKKLKGHKYLFRTVKNLKDEGFNNIKILVLGEGKHLNDLKQLREQLNLKQEIKFLGFRYNTKDFYNIFDLLCLPSNYEGLSLVLIEAMACETLILCSDIPNNIEVVNHGLDGIIFKKGNVNDLTEQIKLIITNKYDIKMIKKNARKKVVRFFNVENSIKKLERLYLKYL